MDRVTLALGVAASAALTAWSSTTEAIAPSDL